MWIHEYEATAAASPGAVWRVLADVNNWASWDTSMEWVRLQGALEVGGQVVMKPYGQEPITSRIVEMIPERRYADETNFAGATLRFSHTLYPVGDGTRVVHRLEIMGPDADQVGPQLGPEITQDFPDAMAALLARTGA